MEASHGLSTLIAPAFNLGLLATLLFVKVKQPTRDFIRQRHATLKDELMSVRQMLSSAQERYDEFSAKLKTIDSEITVLREQTKQDAKLAQQRIASEAQRLSATIVTDARAAAGGLYTDLKSQLLTELGGRVLERAETLLRDRLTGDDRVRIRQEFSAHLEGNG